MTTVKTLGTVVIHVEACKDCDLCIEACPPNVLVMTTHQVNARGYRYPQLLPGCTGCNICQKKCPENAIIGVMLNPHFIVEEKCSGCGICFDVCKFSAIYFK